MAAATTEEGILQIAAITTLFRVFFIQTLNNYRNNFVKTLPNLMINIRHT
jgi:hypothetical protein